MWFLRVRKRELVQYLLGSLSIGIIFQDLFAERIMETLQGFSGPVAAQKVAAEVPDDIHSTGAT